MYRSKIMRHIRLSYRISVREISNAIGISHSYYTEIELQTMTNTPYLHNLLAKGFANLIEQRKADIQQLEADYLKYKDQLLDWEDFS